MISVIVPVYKVEPYLNCCIRSIVEQTYTDLEIILVDDGSPDHCPAICDEWAERDNRIRVIHQSNAGAGAARNRALDVASGEMIAFVDSDDYLAPEMYAHLCSLLEQGADIAECGYRNVYDDNAFLGDGKDSARFYTARDALAEHIQDRIFRQLIWNKLYRRETIGDIRFPTGKKIDDEFFTYQVLGNAKSLIHPDQIYYAYRQQKTSVMHSLTSQARLQAVEAKELRHQYILAQFPALAAESLKNLWFTCIYQGQLAMSRLHGEEKAAVLGDISAVLKRNPIPFNPGSLFDRKDSTWLLMARISLKMTCRLRNWMKVGE